MQPFQLIKQDGESRARRGKFTTPHAVIDTPAFFPVATQGTIKGGDSHDLKDIGITGLLMNAYHLFLRPGTEIVKNAGGLHKFTGFDGTIITDSGGYQIFSLEGFRKVNDEGVTFQSHFDGRTFMLMPENVIQTQLDLKPDVIVPLDECIKYPADHAKAKDAADRTLRWLKRSKAYLDKNNHDNLLFFGIIQGSTYGDLRKYCLEGVQNTGVNGLCIGGLSVGEPQDVRYDMLRVVTDHADQSFIRYFMGYGRPLDILRAVDCGVDLFDCIVPTRYARTGTVYTNEGKLVIRNAPFLADYAPLDSECDCYVCKTHSRAYLRHLFNVNEMAGIQLMTYHNIYWYHNFMKRIRAALDEGRFAQFKCDFEARFKEDAN